MVAYVALVAIYAIVIYGAFIIAAYSYNSEYIFGSVLGTAAMASLILIGQMIFWERSEIEGSGFWRKFKIGVVGLATHYSMLMIGVSLFGAVVLDPLSATTLIAVVLQQALLNGAAVILVNKYGRVRIRRIPL